IAGRTGGSGGADLDLVLWADGRPGVVDLPGENQVPNAVSATGVVVGSTVFGSLGGPQQLRAWIYRDGAVAILPGGESSEAFAVSDDGTAVGAVDGRPVLWRPSATGPAPLAGAGGKALGISADGSTVVGQVGAGGLMRPYVWSGAGAPRELPLPTIDGEPAVMASAQSVTGDWVAGMATSRDDDSGVPVRWNLRTGEVAAFPEHDLAGASSSIDGRITGQVGRRAMVLGGPEPLTLSPLDGKSGLRDSASGISLDGQVVAGNAGNAPVVWRCGATGPR
uniref:hypothetical protein n=1 Tax=Actinoplanes sp. RD1 TaxID=3064538 RepID=UPI00274293C2